MTSSLLKIPAAALALAAACTLPGCGLISDPPTQLEAKLILSGESISDKSALTRNLLAQLEIADLKAENVRIAFDSAKKSHFFRLVGKEALPADLLKRVSAALSKLNGQNAWQGKLIVEADADVDAFLKTKQREFPIVAPWHTAKVDAYLMQSALERMMEAQMSRNPMLGQAQPKMPKRVACMLSFAPQDALPELKGKLNEVMPNMGGNVALLQQTGMLAREMTVPHRVTFAEPELAKLTAPVVEDRKVLFQFALIEDANVTVIGGGASDSDAVMVDHGTIGQCERKLAEVAPAAQKLIDRSLLLAEVSSIGPAQLVALPKAQ